MEFQKKCFWDLLTFSKLRLLSIKKQQYKLCTQCLILSRIHIIIKKLNKQGVGRKTKCHSLQLFAIWIFWYEVHEKTKGSESSLTSKWQASTVWPEPTWIKVSGWWQIPSQHHSTYLRGPESASIEIPPLRPVPPSKCEHCETRFT